MSRRSLLDAGRRAARATADSVCNAVERAWNPRSTAGKVGLFAAVLGSMFLLALSSCSSTEPAPSAPVAVRVAVAPADRLETARLAGATPTELVAFALELHAKRPPVEIERNYSCDFQGPPQFRVIGTTPGGSTIVRYLNACGDTFYTVENADGSRLCFGPQGCPYCCPL